MQESGEMYLETILILGKEKNSVRSIDVVKRMNFSKPSVSRAISKLKEDMFIIVDDKGYISLTEKGRQVAEKIYERHTVLENMLASLGIDKATAEEDACRIEHVISDTTFNAIKNHMTKMAN